MKAGKDGGFSALVLPSMRDAAVNEREAGRGAGSQGFGASVDGKEAFHRRVYNDVNRLAVPSMGDRLGALQASVVRDVR